MSRTKAAFAAIVVGAFCLLLTPALAAAGTIEGTVTDSATAGPLKGIRVCGYGPTKTCDKTGASGKYSLGGLESGSYKVGFNGVVKRDRNYIPEYYNDKSTFEKAEPVNVLGESVASGIDAALAKGGQITGTVSDEATSEPIVGITVCGFVIGTEILSCDNTNLAGEYAVLGLPTNSAYTVEFSTESGLYETEYYDDEESWIEANKIAVEAGEETAGIDAELTALAGGEMHGTVTDEGTSEPIEDASVCAFVIATDIHACDETDAAGEYAVTGLPTHSAYTVEFSGSGYETEYYDDNESWIEASKIAVEAGEVVAGIDAELVAVPGQQAAQVEPSSSSSSSSGDPAIAPENSPTAGQPGSISKRRACQKRKRARIAKRGGGKLRCSSKKANRR